MLYICLVKQRLAAPHFKYNYECIIYQKNLFRKGKSLELKRTLDRVTANAI